MAFSIYKQVKHLHTDVLFSTKDLFLRSELSLSHLFIFIFWCAKRQTTCSESIHGVRAGDSAAFCTAALQVIQYRQVMGEVTGWEEEGGRNGRKIISPKHILGSFTNHFCKNQHMTGFYWKYLFSKEIQPKVGEQKRK
ncbi:hypothetical protein AMECASPLE_026508 [Ameca splendens]|uniref:Uncharacterized protein n=1 Tax=Ameca splendens TaxID=208324 RepID=A0ABV1A0F6_9TELE